MPDEANKKKENEKEIEWISCNAFCFENFFVSNSNVYKQGKYRDANDA